MTIAKFLLVNDLVGYTEDEAGYTLGCVAAPKDMTAKRARDVLTSSWKDFQSTHPDTDDEFVEYLIVEHGFRKIESASEIFVV